MSGPGRNDPCPCGSGLKYKKCCLGKTETQRPPAEDDLCFEDGPLPTMAERLTKFAFVKEFAGTIELALHLLWGDGGFAPSKKAFREFVFSESAGQVFIPYLIYDFSFPLNGPTLADLYLERHRAALSAKEREWLDARRHSFLLPYEVIEVRLDTGLLLKNLWSGEMLWVEERLGTHEIGQWDLLVARVVCEPGTPAVMEQGAFTLPQDARAELLEMLRTARKSRRGGDESQLFLRMASSLIALWQKYLVFRPLPDMRNMDGDPMVFVTQEFTVLNGPALLAALSSDPSMEQDEEHRLYRWVGPSDDGGLISRGRLEITEGRLIVETNSRRRAGALRRRVERLTAGSALRFERSRSQSFKAAFKRHKLEGPKAEEPRGPALDPEVKAEIEQQMQEHFMRTWPDTPIPALDGLTPRQAARLRPMRPRLVDLLKSFENEMTRAVKRGNHAPNDITGLWSELGLDREKETRK